MVKKSHTLEVSVIGKKVIDNKSIYYINDGIYGSFNCIIFDYQNPLLVSFNENKTLYVSVVFVFKNKIVVDLISTNYPFHLYL